MMTERLYGRDSLPFRRKALTERVQPLVKKLFSQISKKGLQKGAGRVIISLAVNCALRNCVLKDVPL